VPSCWLGCLSFALAPIRLPPDYTGTRVQATMQARFGCTASSPSFYCYSTKVFGGALTGTSLPVLPLRSAFEIGQTEIPVDMLDVSHFSSLLCPQHPASELFSKRTLQSQTMSPFSFKIFAIILLGRLAVAYPHGAGGGALSPSPTHSSNIQPGSAGGSPVPDTERLPGKLIARLIFLNC